MLVRYVSEAVRWTVVSACVGTAATLCTDWVGCLPGSLLLVLAWKISGTRQRARDAARAALYPPGGGPHTSPEA